MGTIKQEELLLRLVEAVEAINTELSGINTSLEFMERTLSGCISRTERGDLLCITGNISTN